MEIRELKKEANDLQMYIEDIVSDFETMAKQSQKDMTDYIKEILIALHIVNGILKPKGKYYDEIMKITANADDYLFTKKYRQKVADFIEDLDVVQEKIINIHKDFNKVEIPEKEIMQAQKFIKEKVEHNLIQGVKDQVLRPMEELLVNQVVSEASVKDTNKILNDFNKNGKTVVSGEKIPTIDELVEQVAMESAYDVPRATNTIIQKTYKLKGIRYVGTLVKDSRPLCRALVGRGRVSLDELAVLLAVPENQQGLFPGTNIDNFTTFCAGYRCRHIALPVF